eukprot:Opistho-2@8124
MGRRSHRAHTHSYIVARPHTYTYAYSQTHMHIHICTKHRMTPQRFTLPLLCYSLLRSQELLRLSYHPPDIIYENVLKALVVSTATRSDVYIAVLDAIEKFVMCVEGGRQKTDQAMLNKAQWLLDLTLCGCLDMHWSLSLLPLRVAAS